MSKVQTSPAPKSYRLRLLWVIAGTRVAISGQDKTPRAQMRFLSMLPPPLVARKGRDTWARTPTQQGDDLRFWTGLFSAREWWNCYPRCHSQGQDTQQYPRSLLWAHTMFSSWRYLALHNNKTNQKSPSWLSCNWRFLNTLQNTGAQPLFKMFMYFTFSLGTVWPHHWDSGPEIITVRGQATISHTDPSSFNNY